MDLQSLAKGKKSPGRQDKTRQTKSLVHSSRIFSHSFLLLFLIPPSSPSTVPKPFLPQSLNLFPLPLRWKGLPGQAGFHAIYCLVGAMPKALCPGICGWHWHPGSGPVLCSSCTGQLAEPFRVKHLGLWNWRHFSDFARTFLAECYVTKSSGEEGTGWDYAVWDIVSCRCTSLMESRLYSKDSSRRCTGGI